MEMRDRCSICLLTMNRGEIIRLEPCRHLLHQQCRESMALRSACPICRGQVDETTLIARKIYKRNTNEDRERILQCANRGDDFVQLARSLNINPKTASSWVRNGQLAKKPTGRRPKILTEAQVQLVITWIEEDCDITLKQMCQRLAVEEGVTVCVSTMANRLQEQLYTLKDVHTQPVTMNNEVNKAKRAAYVTKLNEYVRAGKQIVFIDETNFNLFCRRTKGRARRGHRAVMQLPSAKGPNVHLIGAMSATGMVLLERRRGSYTKELANEYIGRVVQRWIDNGNNAADLVIVADNAPCHARLEEAVRDTGAILLRLGPYSPMLNPIELVWCQIKTHVKTHLRIPQVAPPELGEQRLQYLEAAIDAAQATVTNGNCARAVQHSTTFHQAALELQDMAVGT